VLAGLVGMSASWLKGIERGTRLPPRLPLLVKLAEALAVGDVAVLAGTDMDLGGAEQCLRPVDRPGRGCTFPVTESSLKQ
jgi:transcriptional regulator with XRE-family HTH domain